MYTRILCALLLMAAAGCYSDETIGVSKRDKLDGREKIPDRGDKAEDTPAATAASKPKMPSAIHAKPGELVGMGMPLLGDMDGDGFDEFILESVENTALEDNGNAPQRQWVYLFYGRPEWPDQISTADADAVFETDFFGMGGSSAGDLNGDGLADLLITRDHTVQFIFGSKERLHGGVREHVGPVWMGGDLPPPAASGISTNFTTGALGDVDGDGYADLRVSATLLLGHQPDGSGGGLITRAYVVKGHGGEWPSGVWDPAWAATTFDVDPEAPDAPYSSLWPEPAGDLNGDGRDDMFAFSGVQFLIFYGRTSYPETLTPADADAKFYTGTPDAWVMDQVPTLLRPNIGDIDGDGRDDVGSIEPATGTLGVTYGRDWSGSATLQRDLEIQVEGASNQYINYLQAGDIDGDGLPELLVSVGDGPDSFDIGRPPPTAKPGIYVLRGTEKRRTGKLRLTADDIWVAPMSSSAMPQPQGIYFDFQLVGDVDGDDGQDIILILNAATEWDEPQPLYLVPSTPLPPQ